jgi:predicted ATPase
VKRVRLKNYKSIADCDVFLRPLTFLVGPNGAGKSNFLDALRFVTDALRTSLDHALRERGGIKEVRRRSGGHPTHFSLKLEFQLNADIEGRYAFRIGAQPRGGYEVQEEDCEIGGTAKGQSDTAFFKVRNGKVTSSVSVAPAASTDRLYRNSKAFKSATLNFILDSIQWASWG